MTDWSILAQLQTGRVGPKFRVQMYITKATGGKRSFENSK